MTEAEAGPRIVSDDADRVPRTRLSAMRVADLRALAVTLGVGNTSTMRKGTLVDAIDEQYDTDSVQQAPEDAAEPGQQAGEPGPTSAEDAVAEAEGGAAPDAAAEPETAGPEEVAAAEEPEAESSGTLPVDPDEPHTEPEGADEPAAEQPQDEAEEAPAQPGASIETPAAAQVDEAMVPTGSAATSLRDASEPAGVGPGAEASDQVAESVGTNEPKSAAGHVNAGLTGIAEDLQALQRAEAAAQSGEAEQPEDGTAAEDAGAEQQAEGERQGNRRGRGRGRGRGNRAEQQGAQAEEPQEAAAEAPKQDAAEADLQPAKQDGRQQQQQQKADQAVDRQQQNGQQQDGDGRRGRYRDRKRRGAGGEWDEPEIRDDDVLIPIAGILDVLDNYAFVRTSGYLAGTNDVYVSLGQVKKYHLRRGDAVVGAIRQIPEGEQPARQKYNALVKVDSINGLPVAEAETRVEFDQLTPLYPQERLRLETEPQKLTARVVDLVAPIGKGQRGLVVAPPKSGKTLLLQAVANAITRNNPEAHLMVVLVDERPEEVTEMQRTVKGEVVAATFDRAAEDQTTIADLAIERAKRLVELGYDVVVLLDSLTRLTRAYAQTVPVSGRRIAEGVDTAALAPAKRLFAAARNVENGGSLTVVATALTETGSAADDAILAEFTGTANMELVLSSALADKRLFPAIDITHSGTRREEMLMGTDEVKVVWQLRRAIAGHTPQEALDVVVSKLRETSTNVEFLVQMQKSLPSGK